MTIGATVELLKTSAVLDDFFNRKEGAKDYAEISRQYKKFKRSVFFLYLV